LTLVDDINIVIGGVPENCEIVIDHDGRQQLRCPQVRQDVQWHCLTLTHEGANGDHVKHTVTTCFSFAHGASTEPIQPSGRSGDPLIGDLVVAKITSLTSGSVGQPGVALDLVLRQWGGSLR